ncbi:hypothetical protein HW555_010323 [Spodoptera exigua]|uniref:Secreted protein n=1 Tax=Spodoptera exigua TaxID=7107 RepID=A0A835G928_SPOEX|nr:hypothetical protein HW555_010323 [Spodoptera exigua]
MLCPTLFLATLALVSCDVSHLLETTTTPSRHRTLTCSHTLLVATLAMLIGRTQKSVTAVVLLKIKNGRSSENPRRFINFWPRTRTVRFLVHATWCGRCECVTS